MTEHPPHVLSMIESQRAAIAGFYDAHRLSMPGSPWPDWEFLTAEQVMAWTLAFSCSVEMGMRLGMACRLMAEETRWTDCLT